MGSGPHATDPPAGLRPEELRELEGPSTRQSATEIEPYRPPVSAPPTERPPPRAPRRQDSAPPSSRGGKGRLYWVLLGVAAVVAAGGGFAACAPLVEALTGRRAIAELEQRRAKDREEVLAMLRQLAAQNVQLDERIWQVGQYSGGVAEAGGLDVLERPGAPPAASITVGSDPLIAPGAVRARAPRRQVVAPQLGAPIEPVQVPDK